MTTEEMLEKLNTYTRRKFEEDEVYIFSVILCDNEVDRDFERFTLTALEKLCKMFLGKTGIFDHDTKGRNQTARIFSTELISENKTTKAGEAYTALKAYAYMVRTQENIGLIKEIDGGIKKEVSVSCSAKSGVCSICGKDNCGHIKGKFYSGKLCHTLLCDVTDAYEWSFVAVPAQIGAGVTKSFGDIKDESLSKAEKMIFEKEKILSLFEEEIKRDIIRLSAVLSNDCYEMLSPMTESLCGTELIEFKKRLEKGVKIPESQLNGISGRQSSNSPFKV